MLKVTSDKLRKVEPGEASMPLVESGRVAPQSSLCRTTSCVDDPQSSALDSLLAGDLRLLSDILAELGGNLDINKDYPQENFKTLLQIAVEKGDLSAVKLLLRGGADPGRVNPVLKTTPVHLAAGQGHYDILATLTEYGSGGMLTADRSGRSPLHLAVTACKKNIDSGMKCIRICVEKGAKVNSIDNKGGQTPLYLAASNKQLPAVKFLLNHGADSSIPCQGMSTRQLIRDSFSDVDLKQLDLSGSVDSTNSCFDQLVQLLDTAELDGPDDQAFRRALLKATPKDLNNKSGKKTLVQMAADRGLESFLRMLLGAGADPNATTPSTLATPINIAATNGSNHVIQVFLEEGRLLPDSIQGGTNKSQVCPVELFFSDSNGMTILHNVLRKPFHALQSGDDGLAGDYSGCLTSLLSARVDWSKIINKQDSNGNTALHYAVQFWDQDTVTKLLLIGANIGLKNLLGEAPISNILPQTMEDFLNTHCISSKGNPTNDDFRISFKYDFLAPPREDLPQELRTDGRNVNGEKVDAHHQEKVDLQREDGLDDHGDVHPETEVLWYMAGSKDHRHLLKHPVITSFLYLKWKRISLHYNSNLAFYTILVVCLTSYIFSLYGGTSLGVLTPSCPTTNSTTPSEEHNGLTGFQTGLWWTLLVLIALLSAREIFQFCISATRYFHSLENIIEVALIVSVFLLLGYGTPGCYLQTKRELSAAALMFSWVELVTMVGRHPMFTSYNTYLTMFYRVLSTFLLFLTWYSLFILAFSLSFYILLHNDTPNKVESDYVYFDHIGLTIVKTFSMFVGELEFSDIPLSSPFSYVFFLVFVFLIVVVLMNLLNGLAVSDTGLIREEAEIHSHVCRVEVISAAEATILGDPAHILTGPSRLIPSCGIRRKLSSIFRVRKLFQRMLGSNGIMLFYSVLPDKRLVIYPNRRSLVCSPCISSKDVGRDIVDSAKGLVLRMNKVQEESLVVNRAINQLRLQQECMEEKLEKILNKLENLTNSLKI